MMKQKDWIELKGKLELGLPLSEDLNDHIFYFKMVAMYAGMQAESDETKRLFISSIKCLTLEAAKDSKGKFKTLSEIIQIALEHKEQFVLFNRLEAIKDNLEQATVAAATWVTKRPRYDDKEGQPPHRTPFPSQIRGGRRMRPRRGGESQRGGSDFICRECGGWGHYARECPNRKRRLEREKKRSQEASEAKEASKPSTKDKQDKSHACVAKKTEDDYFEEEDEEDKE